MAPPDGKSEPTPPRDWFVAAIEADGNVDDCLLAVLRELELKSAFVRGIRERMAPRKPGGPDAVTELAQRAKALDNTLRFRLGFLRPERPQAWYRAPAATSMGPFSSTLLDEPVFAPYEARDAAKVRTELQRAWQERRVTGLPFQSDAPCLWRTLLAMSAELAALCRLPSPFSDLGLDTLPEGLPPALESRAMRAFLLNVRAEVQAARERMEQCYAELRRKSEELWRAQEAEARDAPRHTRRPDAHARAESVREEFKRRREQSRSEAQRLRFALTTADRAALDAMGFEDLPSLDALRRRYLDLAKKLHPDVAGGEDAAFKTLSGAYSHLVTRLESPLFGG